jgi:hemerythrin
MKNEFILWQKKWETGIKTIDDQHKHFVGIINQAYTLNENGKDKDSLGKIINELIGYARIHFSTEERYFADTDYPRTEEHKGKHMVLLEKILNFDNRFEKKEDVFGNALVSEFLVFLKGWLDNHLVKVDH